MKFVTRSVPAGLLKCIVAAARSGESAEVVLDFDAVGDVLEVGGETILGTAAAFRYQVELAAGSAKGKKKGGKAGKSGAAASAAGPISLADDEVLELEDALAAELAAGGGAGAETLARLDRAVAAAGVPDSIDEASPGVLAAACTLAAGGAALEGHAALAALAAAVTGAEKGPVADGLASWRAHRTRFERAAPTVQDQLVSLVRGALAAAFPAEAGVLGGVEVQVVRNSTAKSTHHYHTPVAMAAASTLKRHKLAGERAASPQAAARTIVASLPPNDLVEKVEIAGPGFINFFLKPSLFSRVVNDVFRSGARAPVVKPRKVAIDYSSPNIAKDMHVGHLRSTIIGDVLSRMLEFVGHSVTRINHVGDWGTQFGMLIAHLKDKVDDPLKTMPDISNLTAFYKEAKARFDAEPDFNERAHKEVVRLQAGDENSLKLWRAICATSEALFRDVYARLGVHEGLQTVGESTYNTMVDSLLEKVKDYTEDDKGARVLRVEKQAVPLILRKGDGGIGYDTTDLAALDYRANTLGCDWLVYVVDSGQKLHFDLVFAGAKRAGLIDPSAVRLDHVGFGVVKGEDNKRWKTRSGETVRLVDLLDAACSKMRDTLRKRKEENLCKLSDEELDETARILGYAGVKYFDLRQNRLSDYIFSYDRMLSPDGDTAVYLEYAHARICSIIRKAGADADSLRAEGASFAVTAPAEEKLAAAIARFPEVLVAACNELVPHQLCNYVYRLCGCFSEFYQQCKVVGHEHEKSRLVLCEATAIVIRRVMDILGITPVYKI